MNSLEQSATPNRRSPASGCYALAVILTKRITTSISTTDVTRPMLGYRFANNLDEAIGSFVRAVQDDKSNDGFTLGQVVSIEIPKEHNVSDQEREHKTL